MSKQEWNQAKEEYTATEIPAELSDRVQAGMAEGKRRVSHKRVIWRSVGTVAACFALLMGGLNLSPTFASAAADVPVVGKLFQVLTLHVDNYSQNEDGITVNVEQPVIAGGDAFTKQVNAEIQERVNERAAAEKQLLEEYKDAVTSTGGTEEDWADREVSADVTYTIKSQTDTTVSFVVNSSVNFVNGYQESYFYNLDVANDQDLTLQDLLGDDWVSICNASIEKQIAESEDPEAFFDESMGGFTTVNETTSFYINQAGNPVVVFPRTSIAIGALGQVEFEITK